MTDDIERVRDALAGRYAIERVLGVGGMATVHLARDLKHERDVAVKVAECQSPSTSRCASHSRLPRRSSTRIGTA